jgi:hypothetical protein
MDNQHVKSLFPLSIKNIVDVSFLNEKNRLILHCYLPGRKKNGHLQLVTINFKGLDDIHSIHSWKNHVRFQLTCEG